MFLKFISFANEYLDKMARLSPNIEIINHFDELINRVDIEFDQSIEKFKESNLVIFKDYKFKIRKFYKQFFILYKDNKQIITTFTKIKLLSTVI